MNTLLEKIDAYKQILDQIDSKTRELDCLKETMNQIKAEVAEEMLQEEVPSVTRGDYTYSIVSKTKYSKKAGSEPELFQALRNNGLGDLIQENINAQRFNSAMNAEAENNGGVLPEVYADYVNSYSFVDISKRKKSK